MYERVSVACHRGWGRQIEQNILSLILPLAAKVEFEAETKEVNGSVRAVRVSGPGGTPLVGQLRCKDRHTALRAAREARASNATKALWVTGESDPYLPRSSGCLFSN